MPNLTRTTPRPLPRPSSPAAKTRILLVRQPVKSVRRSDEPDRLPLRLMIGVTVALGCVAATWLMGYLGFRLGFAPMVRTPDLAIDPADGLVTGTMMIIFWPRVILEAGVAQPLWLMLAFALIAIPAGVLGAIRTIPPGGPRPKTQFVILSFIGAAAAIANGIALIWWTVSPLRSHMVNELPLHPAGASRWLSDLQTVAGLDVLAGVAAAIWVVVAMRLAVPIWMRALSASACLFTLVVVVVAASMSGASVAQAGAGRAVISLDGGMSEPRMMLGFTPQYLATLQVEGDMAIVELRNRPDDIVVVGTQSIVEFLRQRAASE